MWWLYSTPRVSDKQTNVVIRVVTCHDRSGFLTFALFDCANLRRTVVRWCGVGVRIGSLCASRVYVEIRNFGWILRFWCYYFTGSVAVWCWCHLLWAHMLQYRVSRTCWATEPHVWICFFAGPQTDVVFFHPTIAEGRYKTENKWHKILVAFF